MEARRSKVVTSGTREGEFCRRDGERDDGCAYSMLRKTMCSLETDASGKPVQKCEKTEQLFRKCAGRPQELVESKVDVTEEDVSVSHPPFSLDYERSAGSRELPFRGLFERRRNPSLPGSFGGLVQDMFGEPLGLSEEVDTAQPSTPAREAVEHTLDWFREGPFGGRTRKAPSSAASPDQLNSQQKVADYYEALARGIQEV